MNLQAVLLAKNTGKIKKFSLHLLYVQPHYSSMSAKLLIVLFAIHLTIAQKCLYHKEEAALECWELTSRTDFSSYDFKNVTNLEVSSSNLTYLTSEFFETFEHLEILMMSGNAIKAIARDAFANIKRLEYIDLSYNDIDYLNPLLFAENTEIAAIDLSGNQLKIFTMDVFEDLPLLETFNLDGNPIDFCEINTHFALLELRYRNVGTHIDIKRCSKYHELVEKELQIEVSQLLHYLQVFNLLTFVLLGAVLIALVALLLQSKKTGGWQFGNLKFTFLRYEKLKSLPETKIPQAV